MAINTAVVRNVHTLMMEINFGLLKISVSCFFSTVDYQTTYIFNDFKNEELGAELCIYFGFSLTHTGSKVYTHTPPLILG